MTQGECVMQVGDLVRVMNKRSSHLGQVGTIVEMQSASYMGFDLAVDFGDGKKLSFWKREVEAVDEG